MQPLRRVNVFIGDLLAVGAIGRGAGSEREHRRCCSEQQARGICPSWDCPEPRAARFMRACRADPGTRRRTADLGCIFVVIGNLLHAPIRGPALSRVTAATSADEPRLCRVAMVFLSPGACRKGFVVVDYRTVRERYEEPINAVAYARCGTGGRTAGCCRPGA